MTTRSPDYVGLVLLGVVIAAIALILLMKCAVGAQ